MTTTLLATQNPRGWIRSARFDLTLIVGVALLALGSGAFVVAEPQWFTFVLFLDLWLLGYPHVISTFTRIAFDRQSFREHRFLALGLPWLVLGGTLLAGLTLGFWALATAYLYWQWFHYTRQSYGLSRIFGRKAGDRHTLLTRWALYLLPLWGILHRSYQKQDTFLFMEVRYIPVSEWVVYAVAGLALSAMFTWAWLQVKAWREGRLPVALTLYMLSHFTVFLVGYMFIDDITYGWLVINVWHNAQYILIVWMFNSNRFREGVDPKHAFLSFLSQRKLLNGLGYFGFFLLAGTVVYGGIAHVLGLQALSTIPIASIVVYQAINFHHYIVDGLIWKVRKKSVRSTLGLAG